MSAIQDKAPASSTLRKILVRIVSLIIFSVIVGWFLNRTTSKEGDPAGFTRGILHGALMPCQLPRLLVGYDVDIYAPHNTGRTYKLGYTVGVNGCGAIFFGLLYWRVNRWRKGTPPAPAS